MSDTALHLAMRRAGLTDAALAARVGWSRSQICRVRNGNTRMTRAMALAIGRELGVSPDDLVEAGK